MLSVEDNERLTRVGPGTPTGELMRRYWHPIAAAAELMERPTKEVTLLGEDLVLYKDRLGRLGLIGRRCAHRRVSLVYGVPEDGGLRCQYHGWMYDSTGQCIEQPFEETVNPEARFKDRVKLAGYPVQELGGLIFAYLGPEPVPLMPHWVALNWENTVYDIALTVLPCNWLQCQENSLDPVHTEWLHGYYGDWMRGRTVGSNPERFIQRPRAGHVKIGFDVFKYGIIKRRIVEGSSEEHEDWKVGHPILFPNILLTGTQENATMQWRVPMDDTHTFHVSFYAYRAAPGHTAPAQDFVPYRYVPIMDEQGQFTNQTITFNQDYMAWATQGPVTERNLEMLGESDRGVILYRQLLQKQVEIVQDGGQPMNTFREAGSNIIVDVPLEHVKHGGDRPMRSTKYFPGEAGVSKAIPDIERVFATYSEQEPEPELVR